MREIRVSYSELKDIRRCKFKHQLAYVEGWSKEHGEDSALTFGIRWHEVMNTYYDELRDRSTSNWNQSSASPWRKCKEMLNNYPEESRKRLRWMLEGYCAEYGVEPGWKVHCTEHQLIVPLPQLDPSLKVMLKVKIDLVIEDMKNRTIYVDDHKTCANLPSKSKQVDPQLPLYSYALRAGTSLPPVFGARYSYARKPSKTMVDWPLEKRFSRRLVHIGDEEVLSAAESAYKDVYDAYDSIQRWGPDPRDRSYNTQPDCDWCDFDIPCKAARKGRDPHKFLGDIGFSAYRLDDPKAPTEVV